MSDDLLRTLGICGVYEAMTGKSASHAEIKGMVREVKVRNHARVLQCADPMHADEHPSFLVNDSTDHFTCLARGQRGGMLELVRFASGQSTLSNPEAMNLLRSRLEHPGSLIYQPAPDARFSGGQWVKLDDERLVKVVDYADENGVLRYQVLRFEGTHEGKRAKRFTQRRPLPENGSWLAEGEQWVFRTPDGYAHARRARIRNGIERAAPRGRWAYDLDGVTRIPYRLRELLAACAAGRTIFIVEGEIHVDALLALGFAATTNAGGTGFSYPLEWARYFEGAAAVYVIPDCDDTGRFASRERVLHLKSSAPIVTTLDVWPWRDDKYDVINYLHELPRLTQRDRGLQLAGTLSDAIARLDRDLQLAPAADFANLLVSPRSKR